MSLSVTPGGTDALRTLHVRGEVDVATAPLLAQHLSASLWLGPQRIVIHASDVTFMDCAGITVLRRAALERQRQGQPRLLIVQPQPQVLRLLRLTGATDWLDVPSVAPPSPPPQPIDLTMTGLARRLQKAQAAIKDAVEHCDVLRWQRARLNYAAVAFWSCEQLRARGLTEPEGLRAEAMVILRQAETTRS